MKIFLLSLFLILALVTLAQKPKKEYAATIKYVMPPADLTLQQYKTFTVRTNDPTPKYVEEVKSIIKKAEKLTGFERVENNESFDFIVSLSVVDNKFESIKHEEQSLDQVLFLGQMKI